MRVGHSVDTCVYGSCRKCEKKHNSLICDTDTSAGVISTLTTHEQSISVPSMNLDSVNTRNSQHSKRVHNLHAHNYNDDLNSTHAAHSVLLSTALVEIRSSSGMYHLARVVLDSGSERSFISQSLCDKLNTHIIQSTQQIHGVGNSVTQCSQSCTIELK